MSDTEPKKPATRGECPTGPCPFVSCRYHLAIDVTVDGTMAASGLKRIPPKKPLRWSGWRDTVVDRIVDGVETCSLRAADDGGMTLEEVGGVLGITREAVRQTEAKALRKLRGRIPVAMLENMRGNEGTPLAQAQGWEGGFLSVEEVRRGFKIAEKKRLARAKGQR